jgi:hypothetical protein
VSRGRVVAAAAGLAISFAAGWIARGGADEQSLRQVILARALERLTWTASALSLRKSEHPERLDGLLEHGLTEALEAAEREVARGTRLPHEYDFPGLRGGLDRAVSVAELAGDAATPARLRSLRAALFAQP